MVDIKMTPSRISFDFGMPSGHAWGTTCICFLIWDKLFNRGGINLRRPSFSPQRDMDGTVKGDDSGSEDEENFAQDKYRLERNISGEDLNNSKYKP